MTTKFTPGPWTWQGEDYRGDWGWQMLVGPNGEGLIVGQDKGGEPCKHLRAHMPVDPSLCQTGLSATGEHVECVHVYSQANADLIASAPDLYAACEALLAAIDLMDCPSHDEYCQITTSARMCNCPAERQMEQINAADVMARAALKRARGGA